MLHVAVSQNGFQPYAGLAVYLLQTIVGKYTVLTRQRHHIRRNAYRHQVQILQQILEREVSLALKSRYQFEAYAATAQLLVRIGGVLPLGIQHCPRLRQLLGRKMVVADDEIHAFLLCESNLFMSLYSAIEADYQLEIVVGCPFHALERHAIALLVAVGYIVIYFGIELLQIREHESHGRRSVHVVIPVNEYLLLRLYRQHDAFHRLIHVIHQERVVQMLVSGTEKPLRLLIRTNTSLNQQRGHYLISA